MICVALEEFEEDKDGSFVFEPVVVEVVVVVAAAAAAAAAAAVMITTRVATSSELLGEKDEFAGVIDFVADELAGTTHCGVPASSSAAPPALVAQGAPAGMEHEEPAADDWQLVGAERCRTDLAGAKPDLAISLGRQGAVALENEDEVGRWPNARA